MSDDRFDQLLRDCKYPVLFRVGRLAVAKESGTGRWAEQPRFYHGRWERVGGHCWKLLTKWFTLAVWWNWREASRPGTVPPGDAPDAGEGRCTNYTPQTRGMDLKSVACAHCGKLPSQHD